jgi:Ca2+-transporting ATPase
MRLLGQALALSNDVRSDGDGKPVGDPTEVALHQAAMAAGLIKAELEKTLPRIAELPFDSERKRMSTLHRDGGDVLMFCKGAPEYILPQCRDCVGDEVFDAANVLKSAERLADKGFRVLALACRRLETVPALLNGEIEDQLSLLGLVALIDPPRKGVAAAVAECKTAGIVPVMITGDHPGTARAIAMRLGICSETDGVFTGRDLERMSSKEFEAKVEQMRVFARVSPEQKIRIVQALMERGQYVAMTGDGVNDAPALKMANIGIAMGKKGTDVAREAADMVLLDDNFSTIVSAVREGRRIYDNIRKFIKYTMTSNSGEIWTLLLAPFFGLPIPLLPIHILWINLVTDGLPGLAFTAEPAEPGIMRRRPRPPDESIFAHGMWQHIIWLGLFIGGVSIASQAWAYTRGVEYWQTVVFTVLTISQLFHSMSIRSERESLFIIGIFSNPAMLGAVLLTIALQMMVIYLPVFNDIFHTQPLPLFDLAVCFGLSSLTLVAVEFEKWLIRRGLIYVDVSAGPTDNL